MQSIEDVIKTLQERADWDDCDGDCDLEAPHVECRSCKASRALNDAGEILRDALVLDPKTASLLSLHNRSEIKEGEPCACYFCLRIMDGAEIEEWADDGDTALCPYCTIDAIVPRETDVDNLKIAHFKSFYGKAEEK